MMRMRPLMIIYIPKATRPSRIIVRPGIANMRSNLGTKSMMSSCVQSLKKGTFVKTSRFCRRSSWKANPFGNEGMSCSRDWASATPPMNV